MTRAKIKKRHLFRWYKRDLLNRINYGAGSPIACEGLYIDPNQITRVIAKTKYRRKHSGLVADGDWDLTTTSIFKHPKYKVCYERFVVGKNWKEAGAYDVMMKRIKEKPGFDNCYSLDDVIRRYDSIDSLYHQIKLDGKLLTRQEINNHNFKENGGILIHIDRNANFIFGGGGCHRLAIAKILQLKVIPAQVGVVHKEALPLWKRNCAIIRPM